MLLYGKEGVCFCTVKSVCAFVHDGLYAFTYNTVHSLMTVFYYRSLLSDVSKVTVNDLKRVGGAYFSRLFDPSQATTAVCCNPSKVTEVKEGLERSVYSIPYSG